jgi:hypothetical protein
MGYKSRGNWQVSVCLRGDCINRDKKCKECIRFNEYETTETKSTRPAKNK